MKWVRCKYSFSYFFKYIYKFPIGKHSCVNARGFPDVNSKIFLFFNLDLHLNYFEKVGSCDQGDNFFLVKNATSSYKWCKLFYLEFFYSLLLLVCCSGKKSQSSNLFIQKEKNLIFRFKKLILLRFHMHVQNLCSPNKFRVGCANEFFLWFINWARSAETE